MVWVEITSKLIQSYPPAKPGTPSTLLLRAPSCLAQGWGVNDLQIFVGKKPLKKPLLVIQFITSLF